MNVKDHKQEFVYLLVLTVVAASCFFGLYRWYDPVPLAVDTGNMSCETHNCYAVPLVKKTPDALFSGGYLFSQNLSYHGMRNISGIPTSPFWRPPVDVPPAGLRLYKTAGETYNLQFYTGRSPRAQSLPVVLLVADPADLFDPQQGIYVEGNERLLGTAPSLFPKPWTMPANYFKRGKTSRRSAFMVYYDKTGRYRFSSQVNMSISGNATRSFPQKSIRLDAKGKKKNFGHRFFADSVFYSSVVLRNGGNDWGHTLISDGVMQQVMQPAGVDVLGFVPCEVYINGVYWGVHSIRNRSDEDFIAEKYAVKKKKITFMENWQLVKGEDNALQTLMDLVAACRKNPDAPERYAQAKDIIDMEAFMPYLAAQLFFVNTDWPSNNIKAFCVEKKQNSKWRFILFDLDYGMGYTGPESVNKDMFAYLLAHKSPMGHLFKALMKDGAFRRGLAKVFDRLLEKELSAVYIGQTIDRYAQALGPVMGFHTNRWRKPGSIQRWQQEVQGLRQFASKRVTVIRAHIHLYLLNND